MEGSPRNHSFSELLETRACAKRIYADDECAFTIHRMSKKSCPIVIV